MKWSYFNREHPQNKVARRTLFIPPYTLRGVLEDRNMSIFGLGFSLDLKWSNVTSTFMPFHISYQALLIYDHENSKSE